MNPPSRRLHLRSTASRRQVLAGASALSVGLVGGPSRPHARAAGERFAVATNWAPNDIDPHSGYDPGSGFVLGAIYEGLVRQQPRPGSALVPWLAESWETTSDARGWTFHIRQGVRFQDGSPLTATAVRDSFVRQLTLNRAPANVLGRFLHAPEQIVVVDEMTVRFELDRPAPMFGVAMAAPYGASIMNVAAVMQHEVDGDLGLAWAQMHADGLGTGPYKLTSFDLEIGAVLDRFDDYWAGWNGNHFDVIDIRVVAEPDTRRQLIERGEVDLVENINLDAVDELERNPDVVVDRRSDLTVRYLAMTQTEPFLSPEARQALCYAFPYQDVLDGVFLGYAQPAQGPVSNQCNGFSPDTPTFTTDLDKARELLTHAGIPEGTRISTVTASGALLVQSIAELYQANLAKIGVQLDIELMDYASYIGLVYGDLPADQRPMLFPGFWSPDYDDAWSQLWPQTSCDAWSSGNAGHYCNEQVDALLDAANEAPDSDAYREIMADIQRIVTYDDPAGIYFALPEWITVLRHDIGGFQLHPVVSSRLDYYALHRTR